MNESQVIERYVGGDVVGARTDAERGGFKELAKKLAAVDAAYNAAAAARDANRVTEAIDAYEQVLALDRAVTSQEGKYTRAARKALSKLYVAKATVLQDRGAMSDARDALRSALDYNPANEEATKRLASLNEGKPAAEDAPVATAGPRPPAPRSASLLADDSSLVRRAELLSEKDKLLASTPSIGWNVFGVVAGGVGTILSGIFFVAGLIDASNGLESGPIVAGVFGALLAVGIVGLILNAVGLGNKLAEQTRIKARLEQIEKELRYASVRPHAYINESLTLAPVGF